MSRGVSQHEIETLDLRASSTEGGGLCVFVLCKTEHSTLSKV